MVARWRVEPQAAAAALVIEHRALALNPRTPLFSSGTAAELAVANHLDEAISLFHDRLASTAWAVYDVRRIYHARKGDQARKGPAWRSVVQCTRGTRKRIHADLARLTERPLKITKWGQLTLGSPASGASSRSSNHSDLLIHVHRRVGDATAHRPDHGNQDRLFALRSRMRG
ncbi:hypothetical protein GCM10029978_067580 [Actinoallomurus acanthiterrae]